MGFKNKRFTLLTSLIDKIRAMNEGTSIGMALRGVGHTDELSVFKAYA